MNAYELACDIINKSNSVQPCKYAPRGPLADAVQRFMGRPAGHEVFISEAQAGLFTKLLAGTPIITNGTTADDKFAGFVKSVFSSAKQKTYYLLTFCGVVAQAEVESASTATPTVAAPVNSDRANQFAALLIRGAIDKDRAEKDPRAAAGEDYLCTWLSKGQADALTAQLPAAALNDKGNIITQACGSFCYWSKVRMATGSMLLCWMGDVASTPAVASPVVKEAPKAPPGKLIPLDADIPF